MWPMCSVPEGYGSISSRYYLGRLGSASALKTPRASHFSRHLASTAWGLYSATMRQPLDERDLFVRRKLRRGPSLMLFARDDDPDRIVGLALLRLGSGRGAVRRLRVSMEKPFCARGACFTVIPTRSHKRRTLRRSSPGASMGVSSRNARPGQPAKALPERLG